MLIVSIVIEQVIRATGNQYDPKAVKKVETAMRVRKFLWRQNLILNFLWFLCYFILMFLWNLYLQATKLVYVAPSKASNQANQSLQI